MRAEASSGRSDFVSSAFSKVDRPDGGRHRDALDRGRAVLGHRRKRRDAHRDDLLGFRRLHRLDGVAGVDRPLERVGGDDLGDVGDLHDVERGGDARRHVLARRRRRRDEDVVVADQRRDERRHLLGQPVLQMRGIGDQHLADARQLGSGFGGGLAVVAGDEHVNVAAELLGRGDGLAGRGLQCAVGVLGQQ